MGKRLEDMMFNGYVRNPIPMVFFAAIVAIAMIMLALWATIDSFRSTPCSTLTVEEVFVEYEHDGPIVELLATNGQKYDLPTNAVTDDFLFDKLIMNSIPVCVTYSVRADVDEPSREILSISAQDKTCIIPHDAISQARLADKATALCVLWGVCILYLLFILTSYYFISHAPKYPRISSLLIREPYRNF